MRTLLLGCALLFAALAPLAHAEVDLDSPTVVFTVVLPALTAMLAFVLPLDMLMSWIFMLEKPADVRRRYLRIIAIELAGLAVMVLAWSPYFAALLAS